MPRGNYKRPFVPPFDPTITQKIKTALYDAGRQDLVDALRDSGMAELEESFEKLKQRIIALELERAKWLTESGMYRALEKRAFKTAIDWSKWAVRGIVAAAGAGILWLFGLVIKLAWKGFHT